jgi:hypothetical protein
MPPTNWVVSTTNDAGDTGKAPTEAKIPVPIEAVVSGTTRPTVADRAPSVLVSGACRWKSLCIATKRSDSDCNADLVMTQVE